MAQGVNKLLDVGSCFAVSSSSRACRRSNWANSCRARSAAPVRMSGLSKPVVDDRGVTVNLKGPFILGDSVMVPVLIRVKDAELEIRIGVPRIERESGLEQRTLSPPILPSLAGPDPASIESLRSRSGPRRSAAQFRGIDAAGPDLVSYRGQEVLVSLAKKEERQGIGSIHV